MEEKDGGVTVTWGLGEPVTEDAVEFFGYGVDYYGPDGNGGKRFGVRWQTAATAHVWEHVSSTQSNYGADSVITTEDAVVVTYRDANIGLDEVGTINAFSHVAGADQQLQIPVTLLR